MSRLRASGFDQKAILRTNLITSDFDFVNRLTQGLDVEFCEDDVRGYRF